MKQFLSLTSAFLGRYFAVFGSIASITSIILLVFANTQHAVIALIFLVVFLTAILLRIFWVTNYILKSRSQKGWDCIATYIQYSTTDGNIIFHDVQKYIQCKQMILTEHVHEFNWTGSGQPTIDNVTSETMDIKSILRTPNGSYDRLFMNFKVPLTYNKFYRMQHQIKVDDSDHKSSTHVSYKVDSAMQLISFIIELHHKENATKARVYRKNLNADIQDDEFLDDIEFNVITKSYRYKIVNPLVGYRYIIKWDR